MNFTIFTLPKKYNFWHENSNFVLLEEKQKSHFSSPVMVDGKKRRLKCPFWLRIHADFTLAV